MYTFIIIGHIEKLLLKLDTIKANGTDGIKPRVLKECAPAFSIPGDLSLNAVLLKSFIE